MKRGRLNVAEESGQWSLEESPEESLEETIENLMAENRILQKELQDLESGTMKKKKTVMDTPPSCIDEETFPYRFPFIRIVHTLPPWNHLSSFSQDLTMTGRMAAIFLLERACASIAAYSESKSEEQSKHHMLDLLQAIRELSTEDRDLSLELGQTVYEELDNDGNRRSSGSSSSDQDEIQNTVNKKANNQGWRMDIGCSTIHLKMKEILKKDPSLAAFYGELKWLLRLVVECKKGALEGRDMLQAAMYAINEAEKRFLNMLPIEPIYLQVWNPTHWKIGIADIKGFVEVKAGKVVKSSITSLEEALVERRQRRGAKESSDIYVPAELNAILEGFTKRLMRKYSVKFKDGYYPVGTLYMDDQLRDFPIFHERLCSLQKTGVQQFFHTLFSILLGRQMLRLPRQELIERLSRRMLITQSVFFSGHPEDFEAYTKVMSQVQDRVSERSRQDWVIARSGSEETCKTGCKTGYQ